MVRSLPDFASITRARMHAARESLAAGDSCVTLYRRQGLDTDVAVHIRHPETPGEEGPSRLGLQLASALKALGLVEHTLWQETAEHVPATPVGSGISESVD